VNVDAGRGDDESGNQKVWAQNADHTLKRGGDSNQEVFEMLGIRLLVITGLFAGVLFAGSSGGAQAAVGPKVSVVATGLENPRGLKVRS
jgi:hypothetical protein